ncbi:MAG TPA: EAL domain-containing protein, partial [Rhodopila sp.]|nr:EAL domain-containing protein [Rhodopila sp.]
EGAVMADYISAADILTRLRIHGVGISVDDFGTGHSSLLSLLRLPFGELKIDQSFVRGLTSDPEATKIVKAVLSLAVSMDLKVVAEGIENEAICQRLIELGARIGQGYLFAPPLGAAAVDEMLGLPVAA